MSYCVGLTGGIGCGKSTVAHLFKDLGATVIDTDAISHQLTSQDGAALALILDTFGKTYLTPTGDLDRNKMRELIFSNKDAKGKLEGILHPLILSICEERLVAATTPYTLLMAPLLLESPAFMQLVQRVLLVSCSEQNQVIRVKERSGITESQIRSIINEQMSQTERLALTDDIIQNDGLIANLDAQVIELHQHYINHDH
jgi:dephospho-CoA kinase